MAAYSSTGALGRGMLEEHNVRIQPNGTDTKNTCAVYVLCNRVLFLEQSRLLFVLTG